MASRPVVSVIMSVRNGEAFLREAIDSILKQSFSDFEFIIIDDGSTDSSLNIIRSYSDPRIRIIVNDSNIGLARSLNIGITSAKGEYIARMDADDISLIDRLRLQVDFLRENPSFGILATQIINIDAQGNEINQPVKSNEVILERDIIRELPKRNCIAHSSIMSRAKLLKENPYNETLIHSQDYSLWLKLAAKGIVFGKLDIPLLKYRIHENSVGRKIEPNDRFRTVKVRCKYLLEEKLSINLFKISVFFYTILDFFYGVYTITKKKIFYYCITGFCKPLGYILALVLRKKTYFFFFPDCVIAGSEIVHLDIVKSIEDQKPIVIFTSNKRTKYSLLHDFKDSAKICDITKYLKMRVISDCVKVILYSMLNAMESPVIFCGLSTYFYGLIPHLKKHIKIIDIIHAVGGSFFPGMEKPSLPYVDRFELRVAINQKTKDDLIAFYLKNKVNPSLIERILLIENCVEIPENLPIKKSMGRLLVIYVGRDSYEKRVHIIGKVATQCKNEGIEVDFKIIGNIFNGILPEDRKSCEFCGEIADKKQLFKIYDDAEIILLSSIHEGFPMAIMEGMAHGVVPITTNVGGIPIHVHHQETGILIDAQEESKIIYNFVEAIRIFSSDRSQLSKLSIKAYDYAKEHFSKNNFFNSYRELLLRR